MSRGDAGTAASARATDHRAADPRATDPRATDPRTGEDAGAPPVLALRRVTAELGSRPVLHGIDLTVRRGEVVALLGANGSGKSTTLRTIIGQTPTTGGTVEIFGTPQRRFRQWSRLGYVPQRTTASGGVPATVTEVVSAGRLARSRFGVLRRADRAAVRRALEQVGMAEHAGEPVGALSGGQHQRVLIARALAADPELLIMDEPIAGVDLASQRVLADTLRRQVEGGASALLVLHELGPLAPLIDRTVLLQDGRVADGAPPPGHTPTPGTVPHPAASPRPADAPPAERQPADAPPAADSRP